MIKLEIRDEIKLKLNDGIYIALDIGDATIFLMSILTDKLEFVHDSIKTEIPFYDSINLQKTYITGGGSLKYAVELKQIFGYFSTFDEIECIGEGLDFVFKYLDRDSSLKYPILIANIGTGTSFILLDQAKTPKRVGGTNISGGTVLGIGAILDKNDSIKKIFQSAEIGNRKNVDVSVFDIYGTSYKKTGLNGDLVAGSLAKVYKSIDNDLEADVITSVIFMVCNNILHLLSLYATIYKVSSITFSGSFPSIPYVSKLLISESKSFFSDEYSVNIVKHGGFISCFGLISKLFENK